MSELVLVQYQANFEILRSTTDILGLRNPIRSHGTYWNKNGDRWTDRGPRVQHRERPSTDGRNLGYRPPSGLSDCVSRVCQRGNARPRRDICRKDFPVCRFHPPTAKKGCRVVRCRSVRVRRDRWNSWLRSCHPCPSPPAPECRRGPWYSWEQGQRDRFRSRLRYRKHYRGVNMTTGRRMWHGAAEGLPKHSNRGDRSNSVIWQDRCMILLQKFLDSVVDCSRRSISSPPLAILAYILLAPSRIPIVLPNGSTKAFSRLVPSRWTPFILGGSSELPLRKGSRRYILLSHSGMLPQARTDG